MTTTTRAALLALLGLAAGGGAAHLARAPTARARAPRAAACRACAPPPPPAAASAAAAGTDAAAAAASALESEREGFEREALRMLEWERLGAHVGSFAQTSEVRSELTGPDACGLQLARTRGAALRLLAQTEAAAAFERRTGAWPALRGAAADVRHVVLVCSKGGSADGAELAALADALRCAAELGGALREAAEAEAEAEAEGEAAAELEPLRALLRDAPVPPGLERTLRAALDESGRVRDTASPALGAAREAVRALQAQIRAELGALAAGPKGEALAEKAPVLRNGRYCLAVRTPLKSRVPGVVHDASASGATTYIEPREIAISGERLGAQVRKEARAEAAVLAGLSAEVGARADELRALLRALRALDLAVARARYGAAMGGAPARLLPSAAGADAGGVAVRAFRHPLLSWAQAQQAQQAGAAPEDVVPVDFRVQPGVACVVLTGPNTGGKTAALKSLGLCALMARAGLGVPAQPDAEDGRVGVPWFPRVYADVGDGQSLSASLSTFSAHVRRVRTMLRLCGHARGAEGEGGAGAEAGAGTAGAEEEEGGGAPLCLLDELGLGTDPEEGAAIGAATLAALARRAGLVLCTTHLSQLKALAFEQPRTFANAAVEFDAQAMRPTHRVLWGVPGRSHALEVAARLGLGAEVLQAAKGRLAGEALDLDELVVRLQRDAARHEAAARAAEKAAAEARAATDAARADAAALRKERAQAEAKLRAEFDKELAAARAEIGAAVARLQAAGVPADAAQARAQSADAARAAARARELGATLGPAGALPATLSVGDVVVHKALGEVTVAAAGGKGGSLSVLNGAMRVKVKRDDLLELVRSAGSAAQEQAAATAASGRALSAGGAARAGAATGGKGGGAWTPTPGTQPAQIAARLASAAPRRKARGASAPAGGAGGASARRPTAQVPANTVDVRGQYVEDAVGQVEAALARAHQFGALWVIHGHGTGRLRAGVREALKAHRFVQRLEDAPDSQGGRGVTVALLK